MKQIVTLFAFKKPKRNFFDQTFIRKFCHCQFDCFEYIPSQGASGGTILIWKSSRFVGQVVSQNEFVMSIEFVSIYLGSPGLLPIFMHLAHLMAVKTS
jgi:hypothetical protein